MVRVLVGSCSDDGLSDPASRGLQVVTKVSAERGPDARHPVRDRRESIREIELDRPRQGRANGRRGSGADEPRGRVHARVLHRQKAAARGSVAVSDAYFRSATASTNLRKAASPMVAQPGGSIRDDEVIAAADEHGIGMVFTGSGCSSIEGLDGPNQGRSARLGAGHGFSEPRGCAQARRLGNRPRGSRLQRPGGARARTRESRERSHGRGGSSPVR